MTSAHVIRRLSGLVPLVGTLVLSAPASGQCGTHEPKDDPCDPLIVPGAWGEHEYILDVSGLTPDLEAACGFNLGHTAWFSITPPQNAVLDFSTCHPATMYDTVLQVWTLTGDCGAPTRLDSLCVDDSPEPECDNGCSYAGSSITFDVQGEVTYLIQVGSHDQNAPRCELCLGVFVSLRPLNDDCADASLIATTGTFGFDNTSATTDGPAHPDCGAIDHDVWFEWTPPAQGAYTLSTCGLTSVDTKIGLYYDYNTCPPPDISAVACNDDACGLQSEFRFFAYAATSYLIRVGTAPGSPGGPGAFSIQPAPPVCEEPAANCQTTAVDVLISSDWVAINAEDFRLLPPGGNVSRVCWWGKPEDEDPEASHDFRIRYYLDDGLNGPGLPGSLIADFRESLGTLSVDVLGSPPVFEYFGSHADVSLSSDYCYWISIAQMDGTQRWSWADANENSRFAIDGTPADGWADGITQTFEDLAFCLDLPLDDANPCKLNPPNDFCVAATDITGTGTFPFDTTGATTDAWTECYPYNDVWFLWTAPVDGSMFVSTVNQTSLDTLIAVYDASGGCPPSGVSLLACRDDVLGSAQTELVFLARAGQEYFIRLGAFDDSEGAGTFTIAPTYVCLEPPTNCQALPDSRNHVESDVTGRFADDFRLASPGAASSVCWWGTYIPEPSLPERFAVRYYLDDGVSGPNLPGTLLAEFSEVLGTLSVDIFTINGGFEYCGTHAALALAAGTRYWVSIVEDSGNVFWGWRQAEGNALGAYDLGPDGWDSSDVQAYDASWCLNLAVADLAACLADVDADGTVEIDDLLQLLAAWGTCPAPPAACPPDNDTDGDVDINDLLTLLAAWGPCP